MIKFDFLTTFHFQLYHFLYLLPCWVVSLYIFLISQFYQDVFTMVTSGCVGSCCLVGILLYETI